MLVSMKELLQDASRRNYAVAAPNVFCEIDAQAVIDAASQLRAPLILGLYYTAISDVALFCQDLRARCRKADIPIAINQDHGATLQEAIASIKAGCTSIMVDRSSLPYEKNVEQVRTLTQVAHSVGVSVEAELGHVGMGVNYAQECRNGLTDPCAAKKFIDETGIDCLAVAIGTAHGAYTAPPHLDFARLAAIKEAVGADYPLVLHGASGTGMEAIRKACSMGINKINVSNDLLKAMTNAIVQAGLSGDRYYDVWDIAYTGIRERISDYIRAAGSEGRADQMQGLTAL